jgi:general L-amino acid transport system permease protein
MGWNKSGIERSRVPFWRNVRILAVMSQIIFLLLVSLMAGLLYANMLRGLDELGLSLNLDFLKLEAGFGISEGIEYDPSDSYLKAFWVGVLNTVRVSVLGIVFATILGLIFGIARLSSNWLVRKIAILYVETFRNIPLLLQILFWYTAVILQLPPVRQSIALYNHIFINQRGLYIAWFRMTPSSRIWFIYLLIGIISAIIVYFVRRWQLRRAGLTGFPFWLSASTFLFIAILGWFLTPGRPLAIDFPVLQRFNFIGGVRLSPEFSALLISLSVYTGTFIAEIVRGGIQSVKRGQREAAWSIGLNKLQTMRLVILPQALRIIVPPISNQYLNLAKNSSLAIAIGFPDLFNVGNTIMNQTGQSIPVFTMIMASYLLMSLSTSIFLNIYNRKVRIIER